MNSVTIDEPKAPWNDKTYIVSYQLCIEYGSYIFSTKIMDTNFIINGEKHIDIELEEIAKKAIFDEHIGLFQSDFCPNFINILCIYES